MRRLGWAGHLAGVTALAGVHVATTHATTQDLVWTTAALAAVVAILVGLRLHRPDRRGPWLLTAAGLACTTVASVVAPASAAMVETSTRMAVGNLVHLVGFLAIGAAVLWFVRLQSPDGDHHGLVDGTVITLALATVLWSVVIDPPALGGTSSPTARLVFVVAPLLPAGVTALCLRMVLAAGSRLVSARLLGAAWILAFVGTIGWVLLLQTDTYVPGGWADATWLLALGCAGASALHPSMVDMARPVEESPRATSVGRLAVLGIALCATPAALLATSGAQDLHEVVPVAGAAVIALLVLGRFAGLVREREQARHDLEVHAARQEVVARVAEAALGAESTTTLYARAAELVAEVLDADVEVQANARGAALTVDRAQPLCSDERAFLASVDAVLAGMTARRAAEQDLRRRALHDGLTGLPNRALVLERLDNAVAQRERGAVGVLFLDLDGFKPVNDTHGHEVGDAVLRELAARLRGLVRAGDTVGRLAGDEFVLVAPDCDAGGLRELADRVLEAVAIPVVVGDSRVSVHASVGGALADADDRDAADVLRRADEAMYVAKASGGSRVEVSPPRRTPGARRRSRSVPSP